MVTREKHARITVDLGDPELYKAIRIAAIERNQSVKAVIAEALQEWLVKIEEKQDDLDRVTADEARKNAEPTVSLQDFGKAKGWHD